MKRFFSLIISVMLITVMMFSGCSVGSSGPSADDVYNNAEEYITGQVTENTTFKSFTECIISWADENNIEVTEKGNNYLILTKEAPEKLKGTDTFTFHASVDLSSEQDRENTIQTASAVLTAIKCAETPSTVTVIFTFVDNNKPAGAMELDSKYLECDNFIDVGYSADTKIYNCVAASSDMAAHKDLELTSPQYTKAYKIELKVVENQSAYKNRGTYPHAIKIVSNLLASCQSSTILFELVSFEGGTESDMLPSTVTAVIVLHENDVESFTTKFDKSYETVAEFYEDIDDENTTFEYTMTPVDLPDSVISKEDTENVVSLMYTMINGSYDKNDDGVVKAYSNIGKVSVKDGAFNMTINARSLENNLLDDIHTDVNTICGLSNVSYEEINSTALWFNPASTPLVAALLDGMNEEPAGLLEPGAASVFLEKNPDLNFVGWYSESKDMPDQLEVILEYMQPAADLEIPIE